MKLFLSIISFAFLICCYADFCSYNFTINDLESSILSEVLGFILAGTHTCSDTSVDSSYIKFWLYTNNSRSGIQIISSTPITRLTKTFVLIPGWLCNISNDLMPELKEAYLDRYTITANVIIVDWSFYAAKTYGEAYCTAPNVANAIADFLMTLHTNLQISISDTHVVGHSMGGQISGLTGRSLISRYNKKLRRITGLDPAGPLYEGKATTKRLDRSDASFVDIIHTNAGILGYNARCGHVDYYPNCGTFQNGCQLDINLSPIDVLIGKFACDHLRSVDYMIESIKTGNFTSKVCPFCPISCLLSYSPTSSMGENSINKWTDASYTLSTKANSPFSKG